MSVYLILNETVVSLAVDGEYLRCDTARLSTKALLNAYLTLGSVVQRRLENVREASPGTVAGGIHPADKG